MLLYRHIKLAEFYMDAEIKKEFEDLAVMIGNGFARVDEQFAKVDERFAKVDERFVKADEQFEDIKSKMATKDDLAKVESHLDVKIDLVRSDLEDVKVALAKLVARDKADTDALVGDVLELRQKVEAGTRP